MTDEQKRKNRYWGEQGNPRPKAEFFNAVTAPAPTGDGKVATIRMYGPIDSWGGWWGISTKDVGQVLDALGEDVEQIILRINSPGGEVHEAIAILNMFRAHQATVTAVVDGLAASAGSFIAAGCDETVMSPGTNMMIHKPWGIEIGNSDDLRKHAAVLDTLEASMTEIYAAKAGEKDWAQLLADETWMTAAEAVEMGLADRVAVIPDAGETATVTDEEVVVVIDDLDLARVTKIAAGLRPAAALPPSSSEPVVHNQDKEIAMSDTLKAGLLERFGITDTAASDDAILAVVDETIEKATTPASAASTTPPEGTTLIDSGVLADLQAKAAMGEQALAEQTKQRRDGILAAALADGRISPASKETWRASLEKDEEGATALLATLPKNTIPVAELGASDDTEQTADDRLYDLAFGEKKWA
jgi:ATP-dependent Clp endopeptidase proteolytic subunit ClpP